MQHCECEVLMARFTIDTDQQFDQNLDDLVKLTGGTKADVLRKALATYKYLKTEDQKSDNKVSITNRDNVVLKDVILP
jgi:ABC-type taurine transport system substrate-binding protein